MNGSKLIFLVAGICFFNCKAQNSAVWENYKSAKEKGTEAILPDFSYAGYKYSEEAIPFIKHYKVFDITEFGAVPNDQESDKAALIQAIDAAKKNGRGIVFFPKGRYDFFTSEDDLNPIIVEASHIVFRGESDPKERAVLYFDRNLEPKDPNKLWTTPKMIQITTGEKDQKITDVIANAKRETYEIKVTDASQLKKGDWVILSVKNNSPDLIASDIQPLQAPPEWKSIMEKGVQVNERHQIASVHNDIIRFVEPIHYDVQTKHNWEILSFAHVEGIGFENLVFEGNWKEVFEHHKSAKHDGGWSILNLSKSVNSWVKDCTFKNVNNALTISSSAACTALNITIEGTIGHSSVHASGSTGILLAKINDLAGMHHATGVGGGSNTAAVIWRSTHPAHTSFESHASQPRCSLFDNVEGGFFTGRAGGSRSNLPNHGRYLVLWNYKETDTPESNFRFMATDSWYWKFVPPIIVGFHGSGTTFKEDEVQILESLNTPVQPESLFEEQLKLRLGKLPNWIKAIK